MFYVAKMRDKWGQVFLLIFILIVQKELNKQRKTLIRHE